MENPLQETPPDGVDRRTLPTRRAADWFKFEGFGIKTEGQGKQAGLFIVVMGIVALIVTYGYKHDKNMTESLQKVEQNMEKQIQLMEGVIYVISKDQDAREALNLAKPKIIREMETGKQP